MKLSSKTIILGLLSACCYYFIYTQPMWTFHFKAPQYPQGLYLDIYMTGAKGDVAEIDIINHYIGMQKLEEAATNEKALAPYVLIGLGLLSFIVALAPGKKITGLLSLPMLGFPFAFVSIFYLWLYKFGHDLNPAAPVKLTPFTPTILGTGVIGQFTTYAVPGSGFYLSSLAGLMIIIIFMIGRKRELAYNQRA